MSDESSPTPLPSPGWNLLARGVHENEIISRCPAGHIHLDYGYLTIRFERDEFLAFARMVVEAAARLEGVSMTPHHNLPSKPSVIFSRN